MKLHNDNRFFKFAQKSYAIISFSSCIPNNRITAKAVVVSLEIPASLSSEFQFQGGQYINVQTNINDEQVRRSYSICSAPENEKLQIGIKEVPKGVFSTYINQSLKVGDVFRSKSS